jgi:ribonuclease P protein component
MSTAHPLVVLVAASNDLSYSRCAIIVGKSIGGAVGRNRAKRQSRAVIQILMDDIKPGNDLIFILRQGVRGAAFSVITDAFQSCVRRSGLAKVEKKENSGALAD